MAEDHDCECECEAYQMPILDSLNKAVRGASHLGPLDQPTIDAARALARKIDLADVYFQELVRDAIEHDQRPPSQDNVSLPTYLRYCDALGLTPISRLRFKATAKEGGTGGALGGLQAKAGRKA